MPKTHNQEIQRLTQRFHQVFGTDKTPDQLLSRPFTPPTFSKHLLEQLVRYGRLGVSPAEARAVLEAEINSRLQRRVNGQRGGTGLRYLTARDVSAVLRASSVSASTIDDGLSGDKDNEEEEEEEEKEEGEEGEEEEEEEEEEGSIELHDKRRPASSLSIHNIRAARTRNQNTNGDRDSAEAQITCAQTEDDAQDEEHRSNNIPAPTERTTGTTNPRLLPPFRETLRSSRVSREEEVPGTPQPSSRRHRSLLLGTPGDNNNNNNNNNNTNNSGNPLSPELGSSPNTRSMIYSKAPPSQQVVQDMGNSHSNNSDDRRNQNKNSHYYIGLATLAAAATNPPNNNSTTGRRDDLPFTSSAAPCSRSSSTSRPRHRAAQGVKRKINELEICFDQKRRRLESDISHAQANTKYDEAQAERLRREIASLQEQLQMYDDDIDDIERLAEQIRRTQAFHVALEAVEVDHPPGALLPALPEAWHQFLEFSRASQRSAEEELDSRNIAKVVLGAKIQEHESALRGLRNEGQKREERLARLVGQLHKCCERLEYFSKMKEEEGDDEEDEDEMEEEYE